MVNINLENVLAEIGAAIAPQLESKIIHQVAGTKRGDAIASAAGLPTTSTSNSTQEIVDTVLAQAKPHLENFIDDEIINKYVTVSLRLKARQSANAAIDAWKVKVGGN